MVGEPTVPDTINILRGIKEKYETHHGWEILIVCGLLSCGV
jgi:ATP-dependent Clp protease ATP-binding subunit ClpA